MTLECHLGNVRAAASNVRAAASLLHAAVSSMGAFVLRANFITHDPDSPASVTAHENLLTALGDLGLEVEPAAPPMDLVSLCGQHGLDPSRLLAATRIEEFLPLLDRIAPMEMRDSHVRACFSRGGPLPDGNEGPGVANDQEWDVHTDDDFVPDWEEDENLRSWA